MKLNPVIIQRKNLHKKLWDDVRPQNANDSEWEIGHIGLTSSKNVALIFQ